MRKTNAKLLFGTGLVISLALSACAQKLTLKEAFKGNFYVGTALNKEQILGMDSAATTLLKEQFNSVTAENCMKWEKIHPEPGKYNFALADSFVDLGDRYHMFTIGHCLVWHAQTPQWVFEDSMGNPLDRETLLKRMHDHIFTVMSRYKGRVKGYDVVNEALNEDGTMRKSKWLEIIGEDYVQKAFEFAREADPNAELYYNDYNIEQPAKRDGAIKLIKNLQSAGIKITAVGIQGHYHLDSPKLKDIDESIAAFSKLGIKVMFTELDINVLPRPDNLSGADVSQKFEMKKNFNPYPESLPDSIQQKLANRYADFFKIFLKYPSISRITFWGIDDGQSWLNNWPINGRTNYPLIFDRKYRPKAAFYSIIKTVRK
ncbi:MAG TPA: endo-1,4-beta-xylanase [Bacteroidales bacterium]